MLSMRSMQVKLKRLTTTSTVPMYQSAGAAGMDLHADIIVDGKESFWDLEGENHRSIVPTGLSIEIPPGYEAQVRSRSGLAAKQGIAVLNSPGTIDSDYRGEIKVILINTSDHSFRIQHGDRIAQLVFAPVARVTFVEAATGEELSDTARGDGGFGSTGIYAPGTK